MTVKEETRSSLRHAPRKMVAMPLDLYSLLAALAEQHGRTLRADALS
jgi:hypothetical protein